MSYIIVNDRFKCTVCHKNYVRKNGIDNHLLKCHSDIENTPTISTISTNDNESFVGWNKDHIDLALELSIKDQYKDFIPNEDELNEMISQKLCIICASKKVDVAFVDCGHMISCEKCANIIKNDIKYKRKCPICRKDIKNILKIYM